MLLTTLSGNDEVHHYKKSVVIIFGGRRRVLSTAPHNGGYREDLRCVFNHDGKIPGKSPCYMKAPTYAEHMAITAEEIGLDRNTACGISTAADMENLIIKSESYDDITVTALATGGIDVNGGRAGDPATWHEEKEKAKELAKLGTINILLHFNVDLSEGAIARALVTCTEAKSAAIQELQAAKPLFTRLSHRLRHGQYDNRRQRRIRLPLHKHRQTFQAGRDHRQGCENSRQRGVRQTVKLDPAEAA